MPGDVLRARWLQSLERAGVPLEGLASAVGDGTLSWSFLDVPAFDRFAGLSGTTFQQLSAQTGIPLELLRVVREAVGLAAPGPEDPVHEDELLVVPLIRLQLSEGSGPWSSRGGFGSAGTVCAGSPRPRRPGGTARSRWRWWRRG